MGVNNNLKMINKLKNLKKVLDNRADIKRLIGSYFFFKEHADKTTFGSITEEDELGIKKAVEKANLSNGAIVEIGTLFGHTTNLISSIKSKEKKLVAVENFGWNPFSLPKEAHQLFLKRTLRYGLNHLNVSTYEGDAASFYAKNMDMEVSMVFIDAGHDYKSVIRDIEWALAVNCKVIAGHDYVDIHPGVIEAVKEKFGDKIELIGSVWIHINE
jgi:predicted O-methyltransferase YrrM